ncbi:hypothetical protein HDK64DRAFT_325696 [Phyllosticta capitalensis]
MANAGAYLRTQCPHRFYFPNTENERRKLIVEAVLSSSEAITSSHRTNQEFALYHLDKWKNENLRPDRFTGLDPDNRILRTKKDILLPWANKFYKDDALSDNEEPQLTLVHGRIDATTNTINIDHYIFGSVPLTQGKEDKLKGQVRSFLEGHWISFVESGTFNCSYTFKHVRKNSERIRQYLVAGIAFTLALGLQLTLNDFRCTKTDMQYADHVLMDVSNGTGSAKLIRALVTKINLTNDPWDANWIGPFGTTMDFGTHIVFDAHWQTVARNCSGCEVTNHCPGGSGTGIFGASQTCSRCTLVGHCSNCAVCPVASHCVPDITHEAKRGDLYYESFQAFNSELQPAMQIASTHRNRQTTRYELPWGAMLHDYHVILAIAAVTEAISLNGRGTQFGLYSQSVFDNAAIRVAQSNMAFGQRPPIYDARNRLFDVARQRRDLLLPVFRSNHISLAVVSNDGDRTFKLDAYDSLNVHGNIRVTHDNTRRSIQSMRWWTNDNQNNVPPGTRTKRVSTRQSDNWPCGLFTVLNAWSIALDLPLNHSMIPEHEPDRSRMHDVMEAIVHAVHGAIDCRTISQLLHSIQWVQPGSVVPRDRQFKRTMFLPSIEHLDEHHATVWAREKAREAGNPVPDDLYDDCLNCRVPYHCKDQNRRPIPFNVGARARRVRPNTQGANFPGRANPPPFLGPDGPGAANAAAVPNAPAPANTTAAPAAPAATNTTGANQPGTANNPITIGGSNQTGSAASNTGPAPANAQAAPAAPAALAATNATGASQPGTANNPTNGPVTRSKRPASSANNPTNGPITRSKRARLRAPTPSPRRNNNAPAATNTIAAPAAPAAPAATNATGANQPGTANNPITIDGSNQPASSANNPTNATRPRRQRSARLRALTPPPLPPASSSESEESAEGG